MKFISLSLNDGSFDRNPKRISSSPALYRIIAPRYVARETSIDLIGAFCHGPISVPPGAVPHASAGSSSAAPAAPAPYVRRREDALLRAPSRRNQTHLHPDKINGALWFGIDPEVHAFIRATWQGNYWGSWATWNFVPPEKKDQWWHAFIQHYYWEDQFHDEIFLKWKKQTQVTVCGHISQKRRDNRQPSYMSDTHWATMVEKYSTDQAKKKSAKAAKSRKSAPVGKMMHKHGAGPRYFLNIQYNMMVDEGLDEPPLYTALQRKTHTGKDGSFLDKRTEELVLEVQEAVEEMLQDGSPHGDRQTDSTAASNAKRYLLNQEYIKRGKTKKGTIYGLGSVQYKNSSPSVPIPVSLKRNLDVDMRMSGFETTISEVKEDIARSRGGMSASQATLNIILKTLQSQASTPASTAQPFQPQAQSQPQGQPQAPFQSHHQPQPQAQSTAPPQHLSTNTHSDLDRWCQELDINRGKTVHVATLYFVSNRSKLLKSWQALPRKALCMNMHISYDDPCVKSSQPPRLRSQICHNLPGGLASAIARAGSSSSFFRCHVVLTSSPLRRPLF
ncbi:hypothetical protein HID58_013440 [Brassica napus]|uniref:Uncharacterized protein n=1 Tax=Brassica napus TaxID=3708 RepID=A0ABQ8E624_BRANA|nr:hypothetical protein HID58_013440 [Brassica napus]